MVNRVFVKALRLPYGLQLIVFLSPAAVGARDDVMRVDLPAPSESETGEEYKTTELKYRWNSGTKTLA